MSDRTNWALVASRGGPETAIEDAWNRLRERCRPPVVHFLQSRFVGRRAVEEMADGFFTLLHDSDAEASAPTLRPWLAGLLRQYVGNLYRSPRTRPTDLGKREAFGNYPVDDTFDRDWARHLLLGALQRFRKEFPRIHALLIRIHDRPEGSPPPTPGDLSRALGVSAEQATERLARARAKLRVYFEEEVRQTVLDDDVLGTERDLLLDHVGPLFAKSWA